MILFGKKLSLQKLPYLLFFFLSVLIIGQGVKLRWLGYERIPDLGIFDERNYALQGLSIRQNGIPVGWSDSGAYLKGYTPETVGAKFEDLSIVALGEKPRIGNYYQFPKPVYSVQEYDFGFGRQHLKLVQPFMDHSPIGGLVSSLGFKGKVRDFLEITPDKYRLPALFLGVINSVLLGILVYLVTGNWIIPVIALAIYNTGPVFLLSSRFALLENYLIPFVLSVGILFSLLERFPKYSRILIPLSGLLSGFLVLIKETGLGFFIGFLVLLFVWKKTTREKLTFILCAFFPVALYTLWGLWLSPKLFGEIVLFNSSRGFFGSLNLLSVLPTLRFTNFPLDGWWLWGFVSALLVNITESKRYRLLTYPFLGHLLALLFISNSNYPWYFLGIIPFLVIFSALAVWEVVNNPKIYLNLVFALIPLSSALFWGKTVFSFPYSVSPYRLVVLGFIGLSFVRIRFPVRMVKILWVVFCCLLLFWVYRWNNRSVLFMISNWGNLPVKSLPAL